MASLIDRVGSRHGRLTVISRTTGPRADKVYWLCRCDCGKEKAVVSGDLTTQNTVSCGCYLKERITKHGCSGKGSYHTWRAMMRRCYKKRDKDYPRYGGQGVTVCAAWHEYAVFARDMGEPYGTQTLDRIDTYGDYTPDNCRWASVAVQNRNTRVRKNSKSGFTGVRLHNGRWYAEITAQRKKYYSKACASVEEAAAARKKLEAVYW